MRVMKVLEMIVLGLAVVTAGGFSLLSLLLTGVPAHVWDDGAYSEREVFLSWLPGDGLFAQAVSLLLFVVALIVIVKLAGWAERFRILHLCVFVVVVATAIQLVWLYALGGAPFTYDDTESLAVAADAFLSGNYDAFSPQLGPSDFQDGAAYYAELREFRNPGLYFALYPFQCGTMLYFAGVFAAFGTYNYLALQLINVVANGLSIVLVVLLTHAISSNRRVVVLSAMLAMSCLPALLLCEFPYGNSVGMMFVLLNIYLLMRTLVSSRRAAAYGCFLLSFVSLGIAVFVKTTCVIFLVANVAICVWCLAKRRDVVMVAIGIVGVLVTWKIPSLTCSFVEQIVDADFGEGMPKLAWIAMGLRSDSTAGPGWWSLVPTDMYLAAQGVSEAQTALALQSVADSIRHYAANPGEVAQFFIKKIASEWADPTYQSLYYAANHATDRMARSWLMQKALYGTGHWALLRCMDAYQLLIYVGATAAFAGFARKLRRGAEDASGAVWCLLPLCMLAGFILYAVWEAKSVYIVPFLVMMIPCASVGVISIASRIESRLKGAESLAKLGT